VSCEHDTRRVTRTEHDGTITDLIDKFDGKPLNSPNDIVVKSDDTIWFTDPPFGILGNYEGHTATPELPTNVYRFDPKTGSATVVTGDINRPNGLAFSPDESILYVADSGGGHDQERPRHIRAFDVTAEGRLVRGRVFATIDTGVPDGIRVDVDGNLWSSAGDGIHVFSPEGELLGKIVIPGPVSNLTFGGARKNKLFITADRKVWSLDVAMRGAQYP
jgi:gluconolactonase